MQLCEDIRNVFSQLNEAINMLSDEEYVAESRTLTSASIGQHVRHIIEFFQCLETGYHTRIVNYEKRKRDLTIETSRGVAKFFLREISERLEKPDRMLVLEGSIDEDPSIKFSITTNYYRELIYNLEHTVHHMALIRIGIQETSNVIVPETFGVAYSTIKFRKASAGTK